MKQPENILHGLWVSWDNKKTIIKELSLLWTFFNAFKVKSLFHLSIIQYTVGKSMATAAFWGGTTRKAVCGGI